MTDEITARLAGLSGLAVIARQSAILYKKSAKTPQEIGQELDAAYLLEATVSWQPGPGGGSRIRIRPQLIRASDGTQFWADVFDEDLTEVFAVQSRIASRVVEGLGVALVERERRSLFTAPTRSTEAHDSYLRGMQYSNQSERIFDARDTGLAIGLFEKAIEFDPKFAHAYAALSRAHWGFYWWAIDRSSERLGLAKRAADSALALDPELPEARMSLALYHYARLEYPAALKVLDELRAQEPHRAEVIFYIGTVLRRQGNVAGAATAIEDAARLSPRSPQFAYNLGESYWLLRNFEAAERELSRAISLSSETAVPYATRAVNMVGWKGATRDGWRALEPAERFGLGSDPQIAYRRIWLHVLDRDFEKAAGTAINNALPEAFDYQLWFVPRAQWLGEIYSLRNEPGVARVHFESARRILEDRVKQSPDDPRYHSSLGIVYAALGNPGAGVQSARAGVDLLPMTKEAYRGAYAVEALARVYAMTGDRDAAVSHLTSLLSRPSPMSAAILRLDPRWDPLRGHQGFETLLRQHER